MRIINIKAKKDGMEADALFAGFCGEEGQTCLAVFLDECLIGNYRYYLRFCTEEQRRRGGMSVTEALDCRDGLILYRLPFALTKAGKLGVQLVVTEGNHRVFSTVLKGGLRFISRCPVCGERAKVTLLNFYDINDYAARKRELPFLL